ncbi:radical SAM protein [Bradyrhizobium sp. BR 1432]|uniref:radical SAM protein n=1 Tax=Bradyrhizobium sp. BR 1432 TaxID=3447966 RepID=UPI003EE5F556
MSLSREAQNPHAPFDPRRYHELVAGERTEVAQRPPVCLYLEVTNRCNLLCTTCPRTYEQLEPPADMSWDLFVSIVDQVPGLARAVLHGVGEPMLVADLPRMVGYLKDRGVYVVFNTNGTVLSERNGRALIDACLDELRVSLTRQIARASRRSAAEIISAASSATCEHFANYRSGRATLSRWYPSG